MKSNVIVGARVIAYINGKKFGTVIDIELSFDTQNRPIETIDMLVPAELAPTRGRVRGSISLIRLAGSAGVEGMGIATTFLNLPRQKYFSLTIKDRVTDVTLFQIDDCMVDQQSWSMQSKNIMSGSFTFTGTNWANESTDYTDTAWQ